MALVNQYHSFKGWHQTPTSATILLAVLAILSKTAGATGAQSLLLSKELEAADALHDESTLVHRALRGQQHLIPVHAPADYRLDPRTVELRDDLSVKDEDWELALASSWHNDIDYSVDAPCGMRKCYFVSVSDPTTGYLVESQRPNKPHIREAKFDIAQRTYDLAQRLAKDFGVNHLYTAPPFLITTPPDVFLSGVATQPSASTEFWPGGSLLVEPCRTAPHGAKLFKCGTRRRFRWPRVWKAWVDETIPGAMERLVDGLERTRQAVYDVPTLSSDFQFLVGTDGYVYQLDLDRAFRYNKGWDPDLVSQCIDKVQETGTLPFTIHSEVADSS